MFLLPKLSWKVVRQFGFIGFFLLSAAGISASAELRAFSLKSAEQALRGGYVSEEIKYLGYICCPIAVIFQTPDNDVIFLGLRDDSQVPLTTDDLATALRVAFLSSEEAGVSIDPLPDSQKTKKQRVRYYANIENTSIGKAFFDADVVLKKLALGQLAANHLGVKSYFDLVVEEARTKGTADVITNSPWVRFWWYPRDPRYEPKPGIIKVQVDVGVLVSQQIPHLNIPPPSSFLKSPQADETFPQMLMSHVEELAQEFPEIQRLKPLFSLLALCKLLRTTGESSFEFWLREYQLKNISTPEEYPLLARGGSIDTANVFRLYGGVDTSSLQTLSLDIQDGKLTALREITLKSRPAPSAISWTVPVLNWDPEQWNSGILFQQPQLDPKWVEQLEQNGCTLCKELSQSPLVFPQMLAMARLAEAFPKWMPRLQEGSRSLCADRLGGVMLSGMAEVQGVENPEVQWARGQFALVVEGQNARIHPRLFRKFVTALWCVYYSDQDPGISIDPIGPKVDKHLVRYIGRVVNTDLGRVMREADYTMKKWAVGTERPDYPGFQPVDGWMRHYGPVAIGISRRFWFVPENIRFRRGGDLLLFDSGRMRLLTEYNADGLRGQASPADQRFADFFTQHYQALAEKYPIYKELFEYAQLVALAKYLKQNGVPLHWFLMAHKDLVLTEDSPGTVDQLAKASDYFEGLQIQGGVNLAVEAQYVMDAEAVAALQKAWAAQGGSSSEGGSGGQRTTGTSTADTGSARPAFAPSRPVSFALHGRDYTILPQGTSSTGKDHRGLRYQTDLALRRLGKPALELVRYYNPRRQGPGLFGQGWDLLIPYRVAPANEKRRPFLNAIIPEQMVVENLLSGQKEVLTFSTDRYSIAGYVPEKISDSQVVGLFLLSDGSFRLADKLGNQFHFDPAGRLTGMYFSPKPEDRIELEYVNQFTGSFVRVPYRVRPADEEMVDFLNARLPKRVRITDQIHQSSEVLVFDPEASPAGYVPEKKAESRYRLLALRSDGSLHLVDRHGNQVRFCRSWDFESFLPSPDRPVVRSVQMAGHKVEFAYTLHPDGQMVIALAKLSQIGPQQSETPIATIRYEYDPEGRLCGLVRRSVAGSTHTRQAGRLPPPADAASVSAPDASAPAF